MFMKTKLPAVLLSIVWMMVIMFIFLWPARNALAQTPCQTANSATMDCSSKPCKIQMCWDTNQAGLSGCEATITTPTATLPPISGTVITAGRLCEVTMPTLPIGISQIDGVGINAFGRGAKRATPFSLTSGMPPAAPSGFVLP